MSGTEALFQFQQPTGPKPDAPCRLPRNPFSLWPFEFPLSRLLKREGTGPQIFKV